MARLLLATMLVVATLPTAAIATDAFTAGIDTLYWRADSNQPLYSIDDTNGDVRMSKPVGGGFAFQAVSILLRCKIIGDFDVSVTFRDAYINRVNGTPGNQVQLNASFGGQYFGVVRSDESPGGDNRHVFANPPGSWFGSQATTVTNGTMRILRSGSTVSGFFNGVPIYSGTYNNDPATLWLSLQNNGTNDSTSITFDDFTVSADTITCALVTSVKDTPTPTLTSVTAHPNPFNPGTTITYSLSRGYEVEVQIYNVEGRLIRTLVSERENAGRHATRWNGRDNAGAVVGSGFYIVRLRAGHDVVTKKIVMLK